MNTTKKIHVNFSSLLGLKTELLRKQTEVNTAKLRNADTVRAIPKAKKKNKKTKEENANENVEALIDVDDIKAHKKSKLMLEAKSRLYERLKKSKNSNEKFLVDFEKKSDESEEEISNWNEDIDATFEDEDGWVEYKDCFGRTRKCLRRDLPLMQKKDDLVKQQVMNKERIEDSKSRDIVESSVMIEKEPEIEIMRRKWEEQTQKLADKVDIHYQDILFDEARAHGVGYYAFSQDEEERSKQQENLIKLRKETEQKQKEMKEVKELKEKMEQNRLRAARIRKRIRAGLPAEPEEEEPVQESCNEDRLSVSENMCDKKDAKDDSTIKRDGTDHGVKKDHEENKVAIRDDEIKGIEELLGKRNYWYEMSQEEWVSKSRKVRIKEFGPVYENFKSAGYLHFESPEKNEDSNSSNENEVQQNMQNNMEKNRNYEVKSSFFSQNPDICDKYCESNENKESVIYKNSTQTTFDQPPSSSIDGIKETLRTQSSRPLYYTLPHNGNEELTDMETSFQTDLQSITKSSPNDSMANCVSDSNRDIISSSEGITEGKTMTNRNINEESIVVGLRYLREQFEESHNV